MLQDLVLKQCEGFLNSAPLWRKEQFNMTQFKFPAVDLNNFQTQPIPTKIRLGHQVEYVFKQLIDFCNSYTVLLYNLPIKQGKRTLGEIDFILQDTRTQALLHVELTYKFYIINPDISEPIHQLMGPNKRDMFFTKMEKIKQEQYQLLHTTEGIRALARQEIDHKQIAHQACFKAQLFEPYEGNSYHIRPLNKECIVGYWLRFDAFNNEKFKTYQCYIPSKKEWIIAPHNGVRWNSHYKTLLEINLRLLKENAPMVWLKKAEDEFEKFFVVWW